MGLKDEERRVLALLNEQKLNDNPERVDKRAGVFAELAGTDILDEALKSLKRKGLVDGERGDDGRDTFEITAKGQEALAETAGTEE